MWDHLAGAAGGAGPPGAAAGGGAPHHSPPRVRRAWGVDAPAVLSTSGLGPHRPGRVVRGATADPRVVDSLHGIRHPRRRRPSTGAAGRRRLAPPVPPRLGHRGPSHAACARPGGMPAGSDGRRRHRRPAGGMSASSAPIPCVHHCVVCTFTPPRPLGLPRFWRRAWGTSGLPTRASPSQGVCLQADAVDGTGTGRGRAGSATASCPITQGQ